MIEGSTKKEEMKAGFWLRLPSFVIDILFIQIAAKIVISPLKVNFGVSHLDFDLMINDGSIESFKLILLYALLVSIVFLSISFSYFVLFWIFGGQTVGKKILKLKVEREDGKSLTFSNATFRYIGYIVSSMLWIGFIWVAFDRKKQGWHDKIAGTCVVRGQ